MAEAAFKDKNILRDVGKRGKDTNMDSDFGIRSGSDLEKTAETETESLHNFTDFEYQLI